MSTFSTKGGLCECAAQWSREQLACTSDRSHRPPALTFARFVICRHEHLQHKRRAVRARGAALRPCGRHAPLQLRLFRQAAAGGAGKSKPLENCSWPHRSSDCERRARRSGWRCMHGRLSCLRQPPGGCVQLPGSTWLSVPGHYGRIVATLNPKP